MKIEALKQILQKLIAEEVSKQLPKILFEMLERQKPVITERQEQRVQQPTTGYNTEQLLTENVVTRREPKRYVKDPILNKILNETTPGLPQTMHGSSLVELQESFGKIGANEEIYQQSRPPEPTYIAPHLENMPVQSYTDSPNVPDVLKNVFKKDFRQLMKKVDEKKKMGAVGSNAGNIFDPASLAPPTNFDAS